MDKLLTMTETEFNRLEIMQKLQEKRITQRQAGEILQLSVRQIKRIWRKYKSDGKSGLINKKRNKVSNNQLAPGLERQVLDLVIAKYIDFGPTLAHEKLTEIDCQKISRESVRKIMIVNEIWKPKKVKHKRIHQIRERRPVEGELIQIDGSEHDWFEGRAPRCTLLVYVDDATGKLMKLKFVPSESFYSYAEVSREYLETYGKPIAFYSDKHSVFRVNQASPYAQKSPLTQFGRAMEELGIQIICANTPQAKGRIERANKTLQDRLVKAIRLEGISTIEAANAFLPSFCQDFNRRFSVAARSNVNAHRPLNANENLDLIFSQQLERTVSNNLTVQFNNVTYQIQSSRPNYALRKVKVLVCENAEGKISILYKGQSLMFSLFNKPSRQSQVRDSKSLNHFFNPNSTPAKDHPWRQYGRHFNGLPIQEDLHEND